MSDRDVLNADPIVLTVPPKSIVIEVGAKSVIMRFETFNNAHVRQESRGLYQLWGKLSS
jgi:hypothetical protein